MSNGKFYTFAIINLAGWFVVYNYFHTIPVVYQTQVKEVPKITYKTKTIKDCTTVKKVEVPKIVTKIVTKTVTQTINKKVPYCNTTLEQQDLALAQKACAKTGLASFQMNYDGNQNNPIVKCK